ncbi:hypothetical protein JWZ98_21350 [Methylomonas sp. EFPC1]|nr:hypothetical protein [Methylomonas sp. EFPC1]QSB01152.1 hypothetical protein JWZ98_21350 [Methylomonas sp. EFPC1]
MGNDVYPALSLGCRKMAGDDVFSMSPVIIKDVLPALLNNSPGLSPITTRPSARTECSG